MLRNSTQLELAHYEGIDFLLMLRKITQLELVFARALRLGLIRPGCGADGRHIKISYISEIL